MKRLWSLIGVIAGLAILASLVTLLVKSFQAVKGGEQSPGSLATAFSTCVPTPNFNPPYVGTPTSTPNLSQYGTPSAPSASITSLRISKTTDLSPDVPAQYKGEVIVFHCDGTFELFLTAGTKVPLQQGDMIVSSGSPLHGLYTLDNTPQPSPEITEMATPLPSTPENSSTPLPYPASTATIIGVETQLSLTSSPNLIGPSPVPVTP
jgi:hypothetical protein